MRGTMRQSFGIHALFEPAKFDERGAPLPRKVFMFVRVAAHADQKSSEGRSVGS